MSTIDETDADLDALSNFVFRLPDVILKSIADGTMSCTIEWTEITRDEDNFPTIKPRLVLTSTKGEKNAGDTTAS